MDSILQFLSDCGTVLSRYGISFLRGAGLTVALAVACTASGCVIRFGVGLIRSIPTQPGQPPFQLGLLRVWERSLSGAEHYELTGDPFSLDAGGAGPNDKEATV